MLSGSLNPCYNGIKMKDGTTHALILLSKRLNPCYNGIKMKGKMVEPEKEEWLS